MMYWGGGSDPRLEFNKLFSCTVDLSLFSLETLLDRFLFFPNFVLKMLLLCQNLSSCRQNRLQPKTGYLPVDNLSVYLQIVVAKTGE